MRRRTFLKCSLPLAVSGCVAATPRCIQAADDSLDIGEHIYKSLKWNMVQLPGSIQDKFRTLKEIGYDGVELDSPNGIDRDEAVRASQASGLPIEGVVNSTHWQVRHSDPDPAVRAQALENMRTAMNYARSVGAGSVLLVPGKVTEAEKENHDHVWKRSIEHIRLLVPLAERLKVQILIENVGNGFCETPELFAQYIDEIGSEWVGIHFDIGNFIRIGPPADWIRVLGRRIQKLDVKDRTTENEKTLIGEGQANWPDVRVALSEIKYRGWAAAEVTGGDRNRLKDILDRMNRVLGASDGHPESLRPDQS